MHPDQVLRKSKGALLEPLPVAYRGSQSAVTWRDGVWHAGGFRQQCKCMGWKYQVPWCWGQAFPSIQVRQPNSPRNKTLNYKTSHAIVDASPFLRAKHRGLKDEARILKAYNTQITVATDSKKDTTRSKHQQEIQRYQRMTTGETLSNWLQPDFAVIIKNIHF